MQVLGAANERKPPFRLVVAATAAVMVVVVEQRDFRGLWREGSSEGPFTPSTSLTPSWFTVV